MTYFWLDLLLLKDGSCEKRKVFFKLIFENLLNIVKIQTKCYDEVDRYHHFRI